MTHERACGRGEAASQQLPQPRPSVLYVPHLSRQRTQVGLLTNCLAWKGVLVMDNTCPSRKHSCHGLIWLRLCCARFRHGEPGDFHWDDWAPVSSS